MRTRGLRGASFVRSFPVIFFFISYVFRIRERIRLPIWQANRAPYSCAVKAIHLLLANCAATLHAQDVHVAVPPAGKLYHGLYWGGVGTDEHDPTEHDVTPNDVARYEQAVGKQTAWIYFANNWFESRKFPAEMCNWIRDLRKIPYVRLMLRSDVDQKHSEKFFSLQKRSEEHTSELQSQSNLVCRLLLERKTAATP